MSPKKFRHCKLTALHLSRQLFSALRLAEKLRNRNTAKNVVSSALQLEEVRS